MLLNMAQMYGWLMATLLSSAARAGNFGGAEMTSCVSGVEAAAPALVLAVNAPLLQTGQHAVTETLFTVTYFSTGPPCVQGCICTAVLLVEGGVNLIVIERVYVGLEGMTSLVVGERYRQPLHLKQHREADME